MTTTSVLFPIMITFIFLFTTITASQPITFPTLTIHTTTVFSNNTAVALSPTPSAYYCVEVQIGLPRFPVKLALSTSIPTTWVQWVECVVCLDVPSKYMNFNPSDGFQLVAGDDANYCVPPVAKTATSADLCWYDIGFSQGILGNDTFVLVSPASVPNPPPSASSPPPSLKINNFIFGLGKKNTANFGARSPIVGQLGLGKGHPSSTLSQLNISRFSYCLPPSNSNHQNTTATLEFGPKAGLTTAYYYNTPIVEGPPDHPFDYYLNLTVIAVNNASVYTPSEQRGGEPGFVIDVGATVTVLYKEAYIPMKNAVMEYLSSHFGLYPVYPSPPEYDPPAYELCYYNEDLESLTTLTYPNISFHFEGGAVLQLPESQAFHNFVDELQTCLVMIPRTGTEPSRLGAPQQRGWRFTYDLLLSELSFAPNGC
ncbi:hypothetical protein ACFX1Q_010241 [Malus domestica]|uniref:aspartyl protease AED1-like n=1 Tax=Malus domestica TaxID=3750 RepID=UPI0010A9FBAB|nr:aspartyl protease family protein 2-like [Malus domestica]